MALDATKPTDQELQSVIPWYIREGRTTINSILTLIAGLGLGVGTLPDVGVTNISVLLGTTFLTVGAAADLGEFGLESVIISGTGAAALTSILLGMNGQVKVFVFQDVNVSFVDSNTKAGGTFYLNQLPLGTFTPAIDDVLAVMNIGGDGVTVSGYWKEIYRTLSVR